MRTYQWIGLVTGLLAAFSTGCSAGDSPQPTPKQASLLEAVTLEVEQPDGSEAPVFRLQAISSALDDASVWVSGTSGVYAVAPAGTSSEWAIGRFEPGDLEFRDVQAISTRRAVLLAAGTGSASRLYSTQDGGLSWTLGWQGEDLAESGDETAGPVFLDCMDFWDASRGIVYGDSVDADLFVLTTKDGGRSWQRPLTMPPARKGEGGFAASGDCLQVAKGGWVGIVTGASEQSRLLVSRDYGASWTFTDLPLPGGASGGAFALAVHETEPEEHRMFVAGGDLEQTETQQANVVVSEDGGATWQKLAILPFPGPVYGLAVDFARGTGQETLVAVGPGGVARSDDGGHTFEFWTEAEHWSVAFTESGQGVMVGPGGRVTRFSLASHAYPSSRQ